MRIKSTLALFTLMLAMPFMLQAHPVEPNKARIVANNYLKAIGQRQLTLQDITYTTQYTQFYIFAATDGKGFVLVSADDCVLPILGYSTTSTFAVEGMPANVSGWLEDYERQILFYKNRQAHRPSPWTTQEGDTVAETWAQLLSNTPALPPLTTAIAPLVTTTWGQRPYYNDLCPYNASTGQKSPTGCVATAMAQIMKFWNHPTTGYGSHSYTPDSYAARSANFGATTYLWSSMPTQLTSSSSTAQVNAVATLMHHVGVALEMQYGENSSGAYSYSYGSCTDASAENALRTYFKYKPTLKQVTFTDYTTASWAAMLTSELLAGRPVLYNGQDSSSGHAFICDGLNNSGLFHFNWGWNGYCDGYYAIGSLNPTSGGTGGTSSGTYNINNNAVIGIEPNPSFGSTTTVTTSSNNASYGTVSGGGTFTDTNAHIVTVTASAASGCRFTGWSDEYRFNPRSFYANGGTYNFTANFEPLSGDTLGYTANSYVISLRDNSGTSIWGIKLPSSVLTPNHDLTHVSLYAIEAGNYTLRIYTGTSSPSTLAHTQTVNIPSSMVNQWYTIPLSSPIAIDGTKSVWISFSYTGSNNAFPATMSYDSGNPEGLLWGSNLQYLTSWDYSFMIRGIFTDNTPATLGDTVAYCGDSTFVNAIGSSSNINMQWGIRLPATMHRHRNYLTHVMLYVANPATLTLNIYQGASTSASTLVSTQTVSFTSTQQDSWQTIPIPEGVALNSTLPLWITFSANGSTYPAAMSSFCGDTNSSLISTNGTTWTSLATATSNNLNGSWMIRAILSQDAPAPSVYISGPSTVGENVPASFSAIGLPGATYSWTLAGATPSTATGPTATAVWSTPGTYNVIVASTTPTSVAHDTLQVHVQSCGVTTFPYTIGAEPSDPLACWNFIDNDNDGHGWQTDFCPADSVHSGSHAFASASYINNTGALTPDNWLVSPAIVLDSGYTYTLSWYDRAYDRNYPSDHYSVYVSTTGNNVSNFSDTPLFQTTLTSNSYTQRTVDLSSFVGQTINIAFRHHSCTDQYWMILDDITITRTAIPTYTLTVLSNNTAMGTVTGSGTYAEGTAVTIAATPTAGHHFLYWNDGNHNATRTVTVTANATYTATFAQDTAYYTLTVLSNDTAMGTVTGSGTYAEGTAVTIAATPTAGHHFLYWNDGNHNSTRTVTVTADATYTATFAQDTAYYTLTVLANDTTMGTVTGSGTYAEGTAVTIAATPTAGHHFLFWNDGNHNATRTVTVTADATYTATFAQDTAYYTLTVLSNDNTMGTVSGSGTYAEGTAVTIAATPTAGHHFLFWNDGNHNATRTVTVNADATYTATFAQDTAYYTLTVLSNDNTMGTVTGSGTYAEGTAVTIAATPTAGHHFLFWNDGNHNATRTVTVNANATYTATFAQDTAYYTLTVLSNDNTMGTVSGSGTYAEGTAVTIAATPTAGHHFLYWNDGNHNATRTVTVTADATYTATFAQDTAYYTLTVLSNDNSMGTVTGSGTYAEGTAVTITATPTAGHHFLYWNDGNHNATRTVTVTADATYTATFAQDTAYYNLTVLANDTTMGTVTGSGTYAEGTAVTITATPTAGHHFLYWNDGNHNASRTVTVTANATYTATFAQDTAYYTLTVLANDTTMGTVTGSGTYAEGTAVTIAATPTAGHHFLFWNDGNHNATRTVTVTADATYTATFAQDTAYYTLTVLSNDNTMGTVTGSGTYAEGTAVTIAATPTAGHHFLFWNDGSHNATRTVTVNADATYTATFAQDTAYYTLTVLANDTAMGTVTGSGTYAEGTAVTIAATPTAGHHFLYWNDGNHNATRTVTVTANATYTATFAQDTAYYTLTVLANDTAMGTVTGSGTYAEGTAVTIAATPTAGHHFLFWNDGDHNATRTVTVTADATYTATFEADQPEGIDDISGAITITQQSGNQIVVEGATGIPIAVYDLMGRIVAHTRTAQAATRLTLPRRGVYLVKIAALPARRIIIM